MSTKKQQAPVDAVSQALEPVLRVDRPHIIIPRPDTPLERCPTSLDLRSERGRAALVAAVGVGDLDVSLGHPLTMEVQDYLVFPASKTDEETGELREFIRTALIRPDGTIFSTTSPTVLDRLGAVVQLWGRGPWIPPLRVCVSARVARKSGRTFHDLRVLLSDGGGNGG